MSRIYVSQVGFIGKGLKIQDASAKNAKPSGSHFLIHLQEKEIHLNFPYPLRYRLSTKISSHLYLTSENRHRYLSADSFLIFPL